MNNDIIRMAREAGAIPIHKSPKEFAVVGNEAIERFAELVRADEREACAKVCDDLHPGLATKRAAEIIRARGNT
jgi:hypothetical protein